MPTNRSRYTPFDTVKVVIVGQDPYHNVNQAHGLAFSVRPPTRAPPSLRNMYTALRRDYPRFLAPASNGGLLTPWAERGVLLLNTCLTVRAHEPGSHANRGWERFTQRVIDLVAARRSRGVAFMAWGTPAAKRVQKVDATRHLVLRAVHPSPLSASRGFFDCGHFRRANEWLVDRYGPAGRVDWSLVGPSVFEPEPAPEPAPATCGAAEKKEEEGGEEEECKEGGEDRNQAAEKKGDKDTGGEEEASKNNKVEEGKGTEKNDDAGASGPEQPK